MYVSTIRTYVHVHTHITSGSLVLGAVCPYVFTYILEKMKNCALMVLQIVKIFEFHAADFLITHDLEFIKP